MFKYYKGSPGFYTILFRNGEVVRHGAGINFFYSPLSCSIAELPATSQNQPIFFKETTADYQEVSIQGSMTYRVVDPLALAQMIDFTVYKSAAPDNRAETLLIDRVINAVQAHTRSHVAKLSLEDALQKAPAVAASVLETVRVEPNLVALGVEIGSLYFTEVAATPEMRKALETDYREMLKGRADHAIYARRAAAVSEERKIRESELSTDIELENRREALVEQQAANNLTLAEAEAKADEMKLDPYGHLPPQALVGMALKEWAAHPGNIGSLNISPDLLGKVVGWLDNAEAH